MTRYRNRKLFNLRETQEHDAIFLSSFINEPSLRHGGRISRDKGYQFQPIDIMPIDLEIAALSQARHYKPQLRVVASSLYRKRRLHLLKPHKAIATGFARSPQVGKIDFEIDHDGGHDRRNLLQSIRCRCARLYPRNTGRLK